MAFGVINKVKTDIFSYNFMLLGESGVGKTTVIFEMIKKYTNNPLAGMFLEIGLEHGMDTIHGIYGVNAPEWNKEYDPLTNSAGFWTICEDIIENKNSEYPDLKVVVFDTLDQLIVIAEEEAIRLWNKECREKGSPEKCAKTINQAWSGYGRGERVAIDLILGTIEKLRNVGVATIIIGHTKQKQIEDTLTGQSYQVLTSDQQQNYFNAVKKNLHFLGLAYTDREIAKEKSGKKDFNGKDKVVGKIKSEARRIRFRDDGSVVDCKSRFANIVPEIPLDADALIKALSDAIENERMKSGDTIETTIKKESEINRKLEERIAKNEEENNNKKSIASVVEKIISYCTENQSDLTKLRPILAKCNELGYNNPSEIDNIDDANAVYNICK